MVSQQLGLEPEQCLAVEDAPSGVEAAVAAGMRVIVVPSLRDYQAYPKPLPHAPSGMHTLSSKWHMHRAYGHVTMLVAYACGHVGRHAHHCGAINASPLSLPPSCSSRPIWGVRVY